MATEAGILVFDYRKNAWVDHWRAENDIQDIYFDEQRDRLLALISGQAYVYNETLDRFQSTDSFPSQSRIKARPPGLGIGINLSNGYTYMGDAVRDPYLRSARIRDVSVFEDDKLWILSRGFGAFYGSARHRRAEQVWFGLSEKRVASILEHQGSLWIGSEAQNGSLIQTNPALSKWEIYPSGVENEFSNGRVLSLEAWNKNIWLGTPAGIVEFNPNSRQFKSFDFFDGLKSDAISALKGCGDRLYAGGEEGLHRLAKDAHSFETIRGPDGPFPIQSIDCGDSLLVATRYGLYQLSLRSEPARMNIDSIRKPWHLVHPFSRGLSIPSALYGLEQGIAKVFWIQGEKVFSLPSESGDPKFLLDRPGLFRLEVEGSNLFVAHRGGVTIYSLKNKQWRDIDLGQAIPGHRLLSFTHSSKYLWMATEEGISRVELAPYLP